MPSQSPHGAEATVPGEAGEKKGSSGPDNGGPGLSWKTASLLSSWQWEATEQFKGAEWYGKLCGVTHSGSGRRGDKKTLSLKKFVLK